MIDSRSITRALLSELKKRRRPKKRLAAVLVGKDASSLSFLRQKKAVADSLGILFEIIQLPSSLSERALVNELKKLSSKREVGGIIIQLPLPKKFDRVTVLNAIGIEKDVDVLNGETSKVLAPAAAAMERILKSLRFSLRAKNVVVIGSGLLVGEPCAKWLMKRVSKLTIFNKGGIDRKILKRADLIVSGVGQMNLIKGRHIKKDALVIDFGYSKRGGKLFGDIEEKSVVRRTKFYTKTPGGTGPLVVAMLFKNFFELNS